MACAGAVCLLRAVLRCRNTSLLICLQVAAWALGWADVVGSAVESGARAVGDAVASGARAVGSAAQEAKEAAWDAAADAELALKELGQEGLETAKCGGGRRGRG